MPFFSQIGINEPVYCHGCDEWYDQSDFEEDFCLVCTERHDTEDRYQDQLEQQFILAQMESECAR